jgi:hypothetical protein
VTAEDFISDFYSLWTNCRIEQGLSAFIEKADRLIADYANSHDGVEAALQVLVGAAPLRTRIDTNRAMANVYKLGADYAARCLREMARATYFKISLTNPSAAEEYAACSDAQSLGDFICKHGDPIAIANLWLGLDAGPVGSQSKRKEDL